MAQLQAAEFRGGIHDRCPSANGAARCRTGLCGPEVTSVGMSGGVATKGRMDSIPWVRHAGPLASRAGNLLFRRCLSPTLCSSANSLVTGERELKVSGRRISRVVTLSVRTPSAASGHVSTPVPRVRPQWSLTVRLVSHSSWPPRGMSGRAARCVSRDCFNGASAILAVPLGRAAYGGSRNPAYSVSKRTGSDGGLSGRDRHHPAAGRPWTRLSAAGVYVVRLL